MVTPNYDHTRVDFTGFRMWIRVNPSYQDVKCINEVFYSDPYDMAELKDILHPKVVVDIGGHVGSFGVLARKHWPDCRLFVLEPMKENCILYRKNLEENDLWDDSKCHIINRPLGYSRNKQMLHASRTTGGNVFVPKETGQANLASTKRYYDRFVNDDEASYNFITMEELFHEYKIDTIDLLKLDCEGAEMEMFDRVSDFLEPRIGYVVGEYHFSKLAYLVSSPAHEIRAWNMIRRKFKTHAIAYEGNLAGIFKMIPLAAVQEAPNG